MKKKAQEEICQQKIAEIKEISRKETALKEELAKAVSDEKEPGLEDDSPCQQHWPSLLHRQPLQQGHRFQCGSGREREAWHLVQPYGGRIS